MLRKEVVTKRVFETLVKIQLNKKFEDFYLVGGTALSLQLGHRKSIDLDFFVRQDFSANIVKELEIEYQPINISDNYISLVSAGTKIEFVAFFYEPSMDLVNEDMIRLLNPVDIGLFKLLAIQGRSTKKDIVDLYFIDKEVIKLENLLEIFEKHFPKDSFNEYSSLKRVINDEKIKESVMPEMLLPVNFEKACDLVKTKIIRHIQRLIES
jgi:hypothetical protein